MCFPRRTRDKERANQQPWTVKITSMGSVFRHFAMVAWIENKDLLDEVEHDILKPNSMIFFIIHFLGNLQSLGVCKV